MLTEVDYVAYVLRLGFKLNIGSDMCLNDRLKTMKLSIILNIK